MSDWVKFRTIQHPGGGSIDVWTGDCINNPNNPTKSGLQLNTTARYFRLNGQGKWVHSHDFDGDLIVWMNSNDAEKVEDIWNIALKK